MYPEPRAIIHISMMHARRALSCACLALQQVVNPSDEKFRRLRLSNPKIAATITKVSSASLLFLRLPAHEMPVTGTTFDRC